MIDLDKIDDAKALLKKWCDDGMESISTPIRYEQLLGLMNKLAAAEKDAARYRWIKENSQFGVGRCGVDWELYFEGPAPDNSAMIELHIDEAMQCK